MDFVMDQNIKQYCFQLMKKEKTKPRIDQKFSKLSDSMRECLKCMITFNPQKRMEAKDMLRFPCFDDIRSSRQEQEAEAPIIMPFENINSFDYEEYTDNVSIESFQ